MIGKLFRKMLPSQVISNLAINLCLQVDVILIGQFFGVNGVASNGLVNPLFLLFTALTGLISVGISTVCSGLVGRGDVKGINEQFSSAITFTCLFGFGVTAAILAFRVPLTAFLGAPEGSELHSSTLGYLTGYAIGIPFNFLLTSLTSYLHIAGKRRTVIVSIITMTALDIVLDLLNGILIKWDMFGMGLATTISEIGACIVVFWYFFSKKCMYRFSLKSVSIKRIISTLTAGLPIAVNQTCYTISMFTVNKLILFYGGNEGLAVFSVINAISLLGFAICSGVGSTTQVLCGIFYGEQDRDSVISSLRNGIIWSLALNGIFTLLLLALARPFASLYIKGSNEVLDMAVTAVFIGAWQVIPMGITVLFKNYYPVIRKLYLSLFVSVFENLIIMIPTFLLLSKLFGFKGILAGRFATEALALIAIFIIAAIINKKPGMGIRKLSLIEKGFPISDDCVASYEISDRESISQASEAARKFVGTATGDRSFSNYVALCIEEIAVFTIEQNFSDNKNHKISVRLVNNGSEWTIRMRDDGKQFDTAEYMKLHQSDDLISHLGIRMVFKLVTEAKYINSLGLNCLTMKLNYTSKSLK